MKNINLPFIFLVLSVVCLFIACTTTNETVKTLLGAPSFVGMLFSVAMVDNFSLKVKDL